MAFEIYVGIGEGKVLKSEGILRVVGVGSCVVIILYDEINRIGGLTHSMLPVPKTLSEDTSPYRYVSTAIPKLLREMESLGAVRENVESYIIGGATIFNSPFASSPWSIGSRNVLEARNVLSRMDIPVVKEEVGGNIGRSVFFDIEKGKIIVKVKGEEIVLR